jgi:hypothetical protein
MEHPSPISMWKFVADDVELDSIDLEHVLSCSECQQFVFEVSAFVDRIENKSMRREPQPGRPARN